ncbi:MAG: tetratricopeptide repeat protein [Paludibacter sp.]
MQINRIQIYALVLTLTLSLQAYGKGRKSNGPRLKSSPTDLRITDDDRVRFTTFFYEAIRFKEAGQYDQALEAYRMCETIDSLNGGLQSELGQLYAALGNSKAALKATKAAYNSAPDNWWYGINLVSLYAALKQLDKAIDVAGALQRVFPNKEEVYQILSTLYKQAEKPEKAIAALNKLEALTGIDGAISMDKFSLYLGMKQNKKAIAEIDKLSAKFPTDMRYKVLRGDIYMYQELPEKAFEIYKHVESEEPNNPYVYVSLSNYYKQQNNSELARVNVVKALKLDALEVEQKISILGDYVKDMIRDTVKLDETESMFKLLVERYPLEEKVYDYYAVFLQYRKRFPEALSMYETMLNINPKNEQTWLQIFQLRIQNANFEGLKTDADRAIAVFPENHPFYFYKGIAEIQLKNYPAALQANKKALSLVTESDKAVQSDYYSQIGDVYYRMDSTLLAFEAYDKALEANPGNVYVLNNYAYYLSEKNQNLKKAESMSAKTIEKEPKNSTYLDTYAWIFYQQGNYSLAKFYIERAVDNLDKKQDPGVVLEHYGDILMKVGNPEKAFEIYQKSYQTENKTEILKKKIDELTQKLSEK